jgi:hypothetical protein
LESVKKKTSEMENYQMLPENSEQDNSELYQIDDNLMSEQRRVIIPENIDLLKEEVKIDKLEDEVVDDELFGHIKDEKALSPHKAQSMKPKQMKVIELYHDNRKSTYIFKEEDESPTEKPRGITQFKPNIKLSNFGLKPRPVQDTIEEGDEDDN